MITPTMPPLKSFTFTEDSDCVILRFIGSGDRLTSVKAAADEMELQLKYVKQFSVKHGRGPSLKEWRCASEQTI
jgi:hypothetical protein